MARPPSACGRFACDPPSARRRWGSSSRPYAFAAVLLGVVLVCVSLSSRSDGFNSDRHGHDVEPKAPSPSRWPRACGEGPRVPDRREARRPGRGLAGARALGLAARRYTEGMWYEAPVDKGSTSSAAMIAAVVGVDDADRLRCGGGLGEVTARTCEGEGRRRQVAHRRRGGRHRGLVPYGVFCRVDHSGGRAESAAPSRLRSCGRRREGHASAPRLGRVDDEEVAASICSCLSRCVEREMRACLHPIVLL